MVPRLDHIQAKNSWGVRSCAFKGETLLKPLLELVQDYCKNNHQTGDNLFPEFLYPEQYESVGENTDHQRADDRSPDGSASARQGSATQHDGRDGVEFVAFAHS